MPFNAQIFLIAFLLSLALFSARGSDEDDHGGFPIIINEGLGEDVICNGAFVSKAKSLFSLCEFAILSSEHCFAGGSKFKIDGVKYEVKEAPTLRGSDVTLIFFETSCSRFPEDRIYPIYSQFVPERAELTSRKSLYWGRRPSSLGYGSETPNVAGKQLRGISLVNFDGKNLPGFRFFQIAGKDTIEKGDSGSPVFYNGMIVGVLSGGPSQLSAPYPVFAYAGQEAMTWALQFLTERYHYRPIRTRR